MIIYNGEIETFKEFLLSEPLDRKKTRLRARFLKILDERLQEVNEARRELLQVYGEKDSNNQLIISNGRVNITDINAYNQENNDLLFEELIVDQTESIKEVLLLIQDIVLETKQEDFTGDKAQQYERWCDIVEQIDYDEGIDIIETL